MLFQNSSFLFHGLQYVKCWWIFLELSSRWLYLNQQCWELLRLFSRSYTSDRFRTLRNNSQQHATSCNWLCKRTQHVTSKNVASCLLRTLRPFAQVLNYKRELESRCLVFTSSRKREIRQFHFAGSCNNGKEMYKKRDARAKLFCHSKPIVYLFACFLPFSMPSSLSLLKLPYSERK